MHRKPYTITALVWLALVLVFFLPVFVAGKVIAPLDIMSGLLRPWATAPTIQTHNAFLYDAISQYLPYDWSVFQSLRQDGYIGWNPYTHSGTAIVENTMLCPGDWHHQLYRFLPFWHAWNTGIIMQVAIGGFGMLALLRSRGIPAAHALVGIVAFGLYSQFIIWIDHRWVLGAMAWSPWILWALLRMREKGRMLDPLSAVFIGLAFRGGHLQACVFVVLLVGFVALTEWWSSTDRWKPAVILRSFLPYALCGIFGSILALDVLLDTVPALLHGNKQMEHRSWIDTLLGIPTLATSILPTSMGTPQGLDVMKFFHGSLFSVKFMGATALLLASLACFRRDAPTIAKVLFIAGIVLPFTPADQWLYSRVTVIFALGGAWLASWRLAVAAKESRSRLWAVSGKIFAAGIILWLLGSILIVAKQDWFEGKLHEAVIANIPEGKGMRTGWMLERADAFLQNCLLWSPGNLAAAGLIGVGILLSSRVHRDNRHASWCAVAIGLCTFGEIALYARTWITFSDKPSGTGLYETPPWMEDLRRKTTGAGTVAVYDRADFDYMQLNTPSAYGIRFTDGYDTVTPKRIPPYSHEGWDAGRCAVLGISHLLVRPGFKPGPLPGWEEITDNPQIHLYRNSKFTSSGTATLENGTQLSVAPRLETPNLRTVELPAGTIQFRMTESYNPGWTVALPDGGRHMLHAGPDHEIIVAFESPLPAPTRAELRYVPPHRNAFHVSMGLAVVFLTGVGFRQAKAAP